MNGLGVDLVAGLEQSVRRGFASCEIESFFVVAVQSRPESWEEYEVIDLVAYFRRKFGQ